MAKGNFSPLFMIAAAVAALWVVSKLKGSSNTGPFTGITPQRGLFGLDQFGNAISDGSGYAGQGIISS